MIFKHKLMQTFFAADKGVKENACTVKFDGDSIRVECHHYETVYTGKDVGNRHYELSCAEVDGKATLHMSPKSVILEGWWKEGSHSGMWRIWLEKECDS